MNVLNLEEKRIKLDEMMLRMENDRIKENEAREEERIEFQLRMLTLLSNNGANSMMPPHFYYHSRYNSASSTAGNV